MFGRLVGWTKIDALGSSVNEGKGDTDNRLGCGETVGVVVETLLDGCNVGNGGAKAGDLVRAGAAVGSNSQKSGASVSKSPQQPQRSFGFVMSCTKAANGSMH